MKKTYKKPITIQMTINISHVMQALSKDETTPADPSQDGLGKSRDNSMYNSSSMNALW